MANDSDQLNQQCSSLGAFYEDFAEGLPLRSSLNSLCKFGSDDIHDLLLTVRERSVDQYRQTA
jgi:hypothetical protein